MFRLPFCIKNYKQRQGKKSWVSITAKYIKLSGVAEGNDMWGDGGGLKYFANYIKLILILS